MKRHYLWCSIATVLCWTGVSAQDLPRGFSDSERLWMAEAKLNPARPIPGEYTLTTPPPSARSMAEWEELQAIAVAWAGYPSILREIVRYAKDEALVLIVTPDESSVRNYLENNGIDLSENVEFVDAEYNTVWIRDYGPNPVYIRDVDSLALVDWIYNRPRPKDDVISLAIGQYLDVPVYGTVAAPDDLVNTGGNFMSDGKGRGFSSALVLMENGPGNVFGQSEHDESAVDDIMQRYMGIHEYVKMPVLPYDGIHHIDMHMKLLDESTLMVGQYPDGVADGPQIEANLQYVLEQFMLRNGREYRVVRMPMPPDQFGRYPDANGYYRTYTNAMFVNKTILVPVYQEQYDTTALRIWQETMPGYRIVGIDCNQIIPAGGAIHCITKEIGARNPLWIHHVQPQDVEAFAPVSIEADISYTAGVLGAWVYYRTSAETGFDSVRLEAGPEDIWTASFQGFAGGTTLEYYIRAVGTDGKTGTRPVTAPDGYYQVTIEEGSTRTVNIRGQVSLDVFPNPAGALTCIPVTLQSATRGRITVRNVHGQLAREVHDGNLPAGDSKYFFHAGNMPSGIYVISLITSDFQLSAPLVIR